ncbi:Rho termination factor N-terminal domain-containing protein [Sediminibacillus massiliensis]|uniref:Rho termination factor N-terminal domain-containing protein n=1 Tax=Sediminibacillus massiliensis TaxID=1926277 RepID=UPI0009886066|nr:Rho termination factor N-terminal domain-containing protein [Sediminibacillus massiliensis]
MGATTFYLLEKEKREREANAKTESGNQEGHETEAQSEGQRTETEEQSKEQETLNDKTVPELKKLAKDEGIDGYSTMTKAQLIKELEG